MSLSYHSPIIDKKTFVGGEGILHGNESGMRYYLFKDEIKENQITYTSFIEGGVCACVD